MSHSTGREEILSLYSKDELRTISTHGCITGVASYHIYYSSTCDFYDRWESEILEELEAADANPIEVFGTAGQDTIDTIKNNLVWSFIEIIATQETND